LRWWDPGDGTGGCGPSEGDARGRCGRGRMAWSASGEGRGLAGRTKTAESRNEAILMGGVEAVKTDPTVWIPLLESYRWTALSHDTVLEGTLLPGLDAASPEVLE